jgi:hydrogenase/urease accessory protein HupE
MATERPGWFGRALRLAVGAVLIWSGIKDLQQAEWLVPGLFVAIAIPLAHTLGLFTFESLAKRTSVLSTSQLFLWNRVYFIGVVVAVGFWRGIDASFATFAVFIGLAMILAALFRYGGCEVTAIPNLILRRDYIVFCLLFSPIDRLERRFNEWSSRR